MYHVHNKLILHRDLKTQNILLDKHQMIVKIGDFGISKILVSKSKAYTVSWVDTRSARDTGIRTPRTTMILITCSLTHKEGTCPSVLVI